MHKISVKLIYLTLHTMFRWSLAFLQHFRHISRRSRPKITPRVLESAAAQSVTHARPHSTCAGSAVAAGHSAAGRPVEREDGTPSRVAATDGHLECSMRFEWRLARLLMERIKQSERPFRGDFLLAFEDIMLEIRGTYARVSQAALPTEPDRAAVIFRRSG